jgi:RNA polymerase sigma factor (sigma-70 family)
MLQVAVPDSLLECRHSMSVPDEPAEGVAGDSLAAEPETTRRLLERFHSGDQAALDALFARYLIPLRRWATGRLPRWARDARDTQDLVQETLLQTFKRIDRFEYRGEGALHAYLRQALMNNIRYELRRNGRRAAVAELDSQAPDDSPSPLEEAIGRQATERYEEALMRLRPEEREVIVARVEMALSYEQLAEALGKPSSEAARKSARRALLRLAEEMKRGR